MFRFRNKEFIQVLRQDKLLLAQSFLLWFFTTFTLYLFFILTRDLIRIVARGMSSTEWIVMNPRELFLYNWFFAAIAMVVGVQVAMTHIFKCLSSTFWDPSKRKTRRIVNEQRVSVWYFLNWFSRGATLFVSFYMMFSFQYDYSLLNDQWYLMILLPTVIYLGLWPQAIQLFKVKAILVMMASIPLAGMLSAALASFYPIDIGWIEEMYLKTNITYRHELQIPESNYFDRIERKSIVEDAYLVFRKEDEEGAPVLVIGPPSNTAQETSVEEWAEGIYSQYGEYSSAIVVLHADRNVTMRDLRNLELEMYRSGIWRVMLNTNPTVLKLHQSSPHVLHTGIETYLNLNNRSLAFMDSINQPDQVYPPLPPSPPWWPPHFCELGDSCFSKPPEEMMVIRIDQQNYLTVNGNRIQMEALSDSVKTWLDRYSKKTVFWVDLDDERTYGEYIFVKDVIWSAIHKQRENYARTNFGYGFKDYHLSLEQQKEVRTRFPLRVYETTAADNFLRNYKAQKYGIK